MQLLVSSTYLFNKVNYFQELKIIEDHSVCVFCYRLGLLTWLVSGHGDRLNSFGGHEGRSCGCVDEHNCVQNNLKCNCDAGRKMIRVYWLNQRAFLNHALSVVVGVQFLFRLEFFFYFGKIHCPRPAGSGLDIFCWAPTFATPPPPHRHCHRQARIKRIIVSMLIWFNSLGRWGTITF